MIWKTTLAFLVAFVKNIEDRPASKKTLRNSVLSFLGIVGFSFLGNAQTCVITENGCPPTDITVACGSEVENGVYGNYVDWTPPTYELDCGTGDGDAFQMSFDLPESGSECWIFNKVQRVGTNNGTLNLWKSDGNATGIAEVTSPAFYIEGVTTGTIHIFAAPTQSFTTSVYLVNSDGVKSGLMDSFVVSPGTTIYEYSVDPALFQGTNSYRLKFEFKGGTNNASYIDLITFDANLFGNSCSGDVNFSVTSNYVPEDFFPVGTTEVIYTATCLGCNPVITNICSFNVIVDPIPATPIASEIQQPNCEEPLGSIEINAVDGMRYSIDGENFSTSTLFENLDPDTYYITAINSEGCKSLPLEIVINEQPTTPTAEAGNTAELTCSVQTIQLNGSGSGPGTLSYAWTTTDGTIDSGANTATPTVSAAGTYTLTVTDAGNGCFATDTVVITQDDQKPTAEAGQTAELTCSILTLELNGSGSGQGTLSYVWITTDGTIDNGANTATPTVSAPGTYTLTVTDADNGCSATDTVVITRNNTKPTAEAGESPELTCSVQTIQLNGSGSGQGTLSYAWTTLDGIIDSGANTATPTVSAAGTYTLTVTDAENGCTATASVITTVDKSVPAAAITNNNGLALSCSVPSTTLTASGGVSYIWSNGETTPSITVTTADTFTVTVTGENGCTATASVTTTLDNTVPVAEISNDNGLELSCSNPSTTLTASGGASYLWSNGETTASITVTTANTFTVTVTGENGCTATASVTTTLDNSVPAAAIADNNGLDLSCSVPSTTLTVSGGVSYLWSNGETTPSITVTTADTFTVTVTGENGCTTTASVTTTLDNTVPVAEISNDNGLALSCSVPSTILTASGGVSYSWSNGETTPSITVTTADTFTVTVTGENGCTATASVSTTLDNTVPVAEISNDNGLDLSCSVPSTTLTVSGGVSYLWSNGETTPSITVTTADTFTVTVTGENGCTATASVTTTLDNTVPVAEISNDNGLALSCSVPSTILTASGGVSYLWSNGETTPSITVTTADTFTVTVTGENGCTATASVSTTLDNAVPVAAISNNNGLALSCSVPSTTLTASGGVSYVWSNGETTPSITVTTADTFTVTVTGENGCTATASVSTTLDNAVPVAAISNNNGLALSCSVPSTTLTASGGVSYLWSNGETTPSITVTTADTFTVTVTGENGCTATASVATTLDNTVPVAEISNDNGLDLSCSNPSTTLTASGGASYLWSNGETTASITVTTANTFTVTVTGENGCTATASVTTTLDNSVPVAAIADNNGLDLSCSVPSTTLTASGGVSYLWSNGETTPSITVTSADTFTVTVTGENGCTATASVTITLDNSVPAAAIADNNGLALSCSNPSTTLTANGGLSYVWSNGETTPSITVTTADTFTVTVTGENGCTATASVTTTLDNSVPVAEIANEGLDLSCNITTLTLTASGGVSYSWTNGSTVVGIEAALEVTEAGTYTVTVTGENGCTATASEIVNFIPDTEAPVADGAELPTVTGECSATVTAVPTATDNCGGTINGTTEDALTYTEQGTYTVTWTFNDGNGNTSTQTQTVIVDDVTAPVADVAELPTVTGECSATVTAVPTATDNCGGTINGTTEDALTYTEQGTYTVTWTFNDGNGNTSTQTQTVIVDDVTAPVADGAELPTVTGECSATVSVVPTATDNCGGSINGTTSDTLTYTEQGTYTVTWTFNDGNGNTSTQTQTVIVDDVTAPVADVVELPTVTGECSATVTAVPTATDNCGGTINGTTEDALTYTEQGTYTVTWTFNDGNGNTSTQTQTVIVDDVTAPVADVVELPTVTGECSATVTAVPTATDNCGGTINGTTEDALTYTEQGTYTVTWTFNDGNGNTSTQTQTVIVDDVTAPVADGAELPTVTGECSATVTAVPTATDNCGGTINGTTEDALTYTEQGTYTVIWTFNDGNGNTSTQNQTVIVNDVTAPVADVAELPTVTGECSATVSVVPTATDNCGGTINGTTEDALTYTEQGTYTVTWTFNDGNGNTSTRTQTVIVDDVTAPVADVAELPTVTGECSATVTAVPTATDNCGGTINGTTEDALTYTEQGTYTVTWTFNDGNGNTSTQTQTVIVDDVTAPVADVVELPTVTGECSSTVTAVPTATDNCGGTINGTTEDALTYTEQGTYTVTWTFNDGNGNTSTQNQTVIVNDVTAPVADVAELPTVTGECSATVSVVPTATDNCGGSINGTTSDALTYTEQGTYSVTWTFNDGNGNTSTQTQTVIVDDVTAPVADGAELPTVTGECSATVSVVPTATDNCGGTINGTTEDTLTYTEQGTYTVIWTFNDGNGNTSTQNQTVIVNDVTAPVADVAELPTVTGECSATVSVVPTATDNCGGSITGTTEDALTYTEQGTYTVTWTFNDGNKNSSTQTQTVIVDDVTAPVANVAELPTVTGECSATVSVVPTATDNCGGTINGTTEDALTYTEQGTYTVTWTFNDGNGNSSTQTQTVIVKDVNAPVLAGEVTQPTCSVATGSFSVIAVEGLQYSINGTDYSASGLFTGLAAGSYNVTARSASGCESDALTLTINAQPSTIETPVVASTNQPTCEVSTGSFSINAVEGLEYSFNGGEYSGATNFEDLTPGNYTITARNSEGCVSEELSVTINEQQGNPAAPLTLQVVQPTCDVQSGSFSISPVEGMEYSLNGSDFGSNTSFSNLEPGNYNVIAINSDGCVSEATSVTIDLVPTDCIVLPCELTDVKDSVSKAVTPNGDGFNDVFNVGLDLDCDFTYAVQIFNRWGAEIYKDRNYQNNWDGYSNKSVTSSNQLPSGTYYYILEVTDTNGNRLEPIQGYIYLGTK